MLHFIKWVILLVVLFGIQTQLSYVGKEINQLKKAYQEVESRK